ncbi:acyl-CoA thioesterase [Telmatospirillum sp. J64-1]|uniref:acyl-CoA thioesterase n=1 Tax=Telmatospirillum sp. J64-1 TaxID=2502183 RepID=UPI00115CEC3B|nr:acyl-CoA thioesterase [Telmatospirillum sp. J64-1]
MSESDDVPHGELSLRSIAMPADTNPSGDIFGGWLLSQMDLAGGTAARVRAKGRVATVGVERMAFHQRVFVGDEVSCYSRLLKVGRTSLTYVVEAWVRRQDTTTHFKATEGVFTFVAITEDGQKRPVPQE